MNVIEWLSLVAVCLLGAMSPGPSLAVVMGNTLRGGSIAGYIASIAHGIGVALYGLLTVAGLSALLTGSTAVFLAVQLAGAAYLVWLALGLLRSSGGTAIEAAGGGQGSNRDAARQGFLIAFLNPKLAVFMLALFSQFLGPDTGWSQRWVMVVTVGVTDAAWYAVITGLVSRPSVMTRLQAAEQTINRVMGVVLILLASTVVVNAL